MSVGTQTALLPYLPRLVVDLQREGGEGARLESIDGTLLSVDISGFTALSERLAARGKLGAEELIGQISRCYRGLIAIAGARGGDVLKFRGDALLIFFDGDAHALRASVAAVEMQAFVDQAGRAESSVGPVELRMAAGVRSGLCNFALVGTAHRELLVLGPSATAVLALEDAAEAGEVLVSTATAARLDPAWLAGERDGAVLLRREAVTAEAPPEPPPREAAAELEQLVPPPLRPLLSGGHAEPEHRIVTAAFVKFTGTDALVADKAAAVAALDELGRVVGETAEELGLTWLESDIDRDGGKLYLLAGAPASPGHDEERMLRGLRAIVDAGTAVGVGAGVNRGHVFAGEIGSEKRRTYAVMGDTVNLAARLAARAGAGRILASAEVLKRSRTRFEAEPQPFLVKGKEQPIAAFWVGAQAGAAELEEERRLALVGREAELGELRAAVEAARRRESGLVELVGPPGIGKSRLVEELRTLAVGFQQLEARGEEYEASTPFRGFRSLLRPLVGITPELSAQEAGELLQPWIAAVMPELLPWLPLLAIPFDAAVPSTPEADEIDASFRQQKLHETVQQLLERMLPMPTLLVVEDVHWLDDASRFLLRHLTATPGARPWIVCATRRPEGESLVRDGNGVLLELEPLAPAAATELALAALGEAAVAGDEFAALVERSGGNPLFLRELVAARAGGGALPETVESVITARIDTLDPSDRLLLRCAAVIGPSFDLELLGEVLAGELDEVGDLQRWERLEEFVGFEDRGMLRFRHDLFRTVGAEGLSFARRHELHRRVGEALERRSGDEAAAVLSLHFFEAQAYEKAWRYAVLAGDAARRRYANVDAAELYERGLAAAEHVAADPLEAARVAEAIGDSCELAAHFERAARGYERARGLVPDDLVAQARLTFKSGVLHERKGEYGEALRRYTAALRRLHDSAGSTAAQTTRAEIEIAVAGVRQRQGRYGAAFRWCGRAAEHAKAADARGALAHAYYLRYVAGMRLGSAGEQDAELALAIYEDIGDVAARGSVFNNLGIGAYFRGDWEQAMGRYEQAAELRRRAGDVVMAALIRSNRAEILSDQGRLAEAEEVFLAVERDLRAAGSRLGIGVTASNRGRAAARGGRFEQAHELLAEAEGELEAIGADSFALEARARRAECLVLEGRHGDSRPLAESTLAVAAGASSVVPLLERLLGYALVQAREAGAARAHFDRSLAAAATLAAEYETALTLQALADTGLDPAAGAVGDAILARLGVVSTPHVPLP